MKQLLSLFLFLLPCFAWAQYPSNGNQKITLGEQTTADGLIYRGVLADTGIITPSSDTSAYIILDTVNHRFYNYNRATNVWSVAGGGTAVTTFSAGSTGLTPSTATSGAVTLGGTLAVANGGTGSNIGSILGSDSLHFQAGGSNKNVRVTPSTTGDIILNGDVSIGNRPAQERLSVGLNTNVEVGFGLESGGKGYFGTYSPPTYTYDGIVLSINRRPTNGVFANTGFSHAEIAVVAANSDSYIGLFTGQTNNVIGTERMRIIKNGNVGIGQTIPTAVLHLKAGTATASTAPLKFTSGTNLTTAEAGAMEFNGTNLFFSPSTTRHTVNHGLTGSATLNFPSTLTMLSADLTITVTGAAGGDVVSLGVPNAAVNANTFYSAWVSAANTVTVRFNNYSIGTVDPASALFKVFVTK